MEWLIVLISLWTYPIVAAVLFRLTKRNKGIRRSVAIGVLIVIALLILGLATGTSTTVSEVDWIILTAPYFLACLALTWTMFQNNTAIRTVGAFGMFAIYGFGYVSSTVGALGVGLAIGEYETDREEWLADGYIFKEVILGNALSDYRGKRVEVSKTLTWLPVLERTVQEKEYYNFIVYGDTMEIKYDSDEKEIALKIESTWGDSAVVWNDTLILNE